MNRRRIESREAGAALLAVLLLVAVMGALTTTALEKLSLSTALSSNVAGIDQARAFAIGIESLMVLRVDDAVAASPGRTTNAGGWNGQVRSFPMPGGALAHVRIRDGGNCFNINSVGEETRSGLIVRRATGIAQFTALLGLLQIPDASARRIAEAAGDWIDSDSERSRDGAEDRDYQQPGTPYRTANTFFAEVSELRALAGMTPEIYARVRPWLCALPAAELSPINVNTLSPDQAPLLAMLAPTRFGIEPARQVLAARPTAGWPSLVEFYREPQLSGIILPLEVQLQPQLRTRWFALDLRIEHQQAELVETALVDARIAPSRVVIRRWGSDD